MKRLLLFLFASALLLSCQSETNDSEANTHSSAESTLFTIEEQNYTATLNRVQYNSTGQANGPRNWQRLGPLSYLLSELYQAPVELENSLSPDNHYELVINWEEDSSFDDIRQTIADQTRETIGYEINSSTRMQPRYVLSISDLPKLEKGNGSDSGQPNFTSKVSIQNNDWEIYASLDDFADILSENTNQTVITTEDHGSTIYHFDLSSAGGFDSLIAQLEENYGIAVEREMVSEQFYTINYK